MHAFLYIHECSLIYIYIYNRYIYIYIYIVIIIRSVVFGLEKKLCNFGVDDSEIWCLSNTEWRVNTLQREKVLAFVSWKEEYFYYGENYPSLYDIVDQWCSNDGESSYEFNRYGFVCTSLRIGIRLQINLLAM